MNAFELLVDDMRNVLGPSSGLDSNDVDVQDLTHLMERYASNPEEWARYYWPDDKMAYTRNLVDEGNGKANLVSSITGRGKSDTLAQTLTPASAQLVLVWSPGQASHIHDHGNAHCLMKILKGNLTETRYGFPDGDKEKPMEMTSERVLKDNSVAYMADDLGLHSMSNQTSDFVVSLHLYTPPNVARHGCHIFNPRTGEKTHTKCGNYSEYGRKL
ncbi:hypothetical protein NPX13_g1477 [Xylaria arbuscula]|uniref:Cysteine dioxygenase n=1 Tax=Xylaria arbuscula TaxID=114810 RepID=A0A9W8NM10_9PEZI|nr:hypothetical protein NPX13_g1477 [Xylaria arbuscula]